ncbi:MAG TPA: helix-turn-helix domain-containing protein [Candidatus Binatia bacterium]|nr:helix-turn-helix domain-containing protein [Candidatus Binatia bacterium]
MPPSSSRAAVALASVSGPKQARSERTLYRLLEAAEALIAERGLAGLSIPAVVARAGSSVGGFYGRFRDKNELLRALEERFFLEVTARLEALSDERRWVDATVRDIVAAAVDELVTVTEERRELIRTFLFRATQDTAIRDQAIDFRRRAAERMGAVLLAKASDVRHPEPALALDLAVQAAFSLMQNHVVLDGTHAAGRTLTIDELKREIARLVLAYVGLAAETSDAREPDRLAAAAADGGRRAPKPA